LYLFPQLKINLKGCHLDTTEVIAAESQVILNTLTEHNFRDAFKNMSEALGTVHTHRRGLL
jgi:predicted helicase